MFHVKHLVAVACAGASLAGAQEPVALPGPGLELRGVLYRPEGSAPHPAVLMLHGCSGLWARNGEPTPSYAFWAGHMRDRGFVALLLDSFGPRGEKEICTQQARQVRPDRERVADAWAARRWLAAQPGVDPQRIFLLGWSNGGTTVLNAVLGPPRGEPAEAGFAAAVAFYPGCSGLARTGAYRPAVPVLIQAGGADDWTPAADCVTVQRLAPPDPPVEIDVYEGAHHAFDRISGRVRYRADVRNAASPTGRGATIGPDPAARDAALKRTTEYLKRRAERVPRGTTPGAGSALP